MRTSIKHKVISLILSFSLMLGMVPAALALEITTGRFNPNTSELQLSFRLQLGQPLEISIHVQDSDGETQVGKLFSNVILEGYEDDLMKHPHLPEDAVTTFATVPPPEDSGNSFAPVPEEVIEIE
ncbi:MAG: hypothetical protein RR502_02870, partial [Oscillospiraceae bacterium]